MLKRFALLLVLALCLGGSAKAGDQLHAVEMGHTVSYGGGAVCTDEPPYICWNEVVPNSLDPCGSLQGCRTWGATQCGSDTWWLLSYTETGDGDTLASCSVVCLMGSPNGVIWIVYSSNDAGC